MTESVRARRTRERVGSGPKQMPWRRVENSFRPLEVLSSEQVERVHVASLKLLADYGIEFQNEEALRILAANGARVDAATGMVRFPSDVIDHFIAQAPATAEVFSWNPGKRMGIGGNEIAFGTVGGPPNCSDLERGRRPGTFQDQCDLIRLEQSLHVLHFCGGAPVEAIDLPADTRHLDTAFAFLTLTGRPFFGRAIGATRIA